MWLSLAMAVAVGAVVVAVPSAPAQTKKLVYWTHWDQQPDFNKWYTEKGKEFAKKTGYEIEVVTIPYQGYEAKYLAALMGKSGAPDFFNGMTHQWCGQYDFCDPMPQDLAKIWDESIPKYMVPIGKWKDVRYGTPLEHGNFQQMYMNVDLFKKAGLDPGRVAGRHEEADVGRHPGRVRDPAQGPPGGHHRQVPALRPRLRRPDALA
jgi:ABC-type glycerol-3-phosphate transport system substrate-binding protein